MIVVGGLALLGSIADLKEYWLSLIVAIGLIVGGIVLLTTGKKKPAPVKAAPVVEKVAENVADKNRLVFRATYTDKYQDRIERLSKNDDGVIYTIKPYKGYEGSTRYSILANDLKIGEAPARSFDTLGLIYDKAQVSVLYILLQDAYDVEVTCSL